MRLGPVHEDIMVVLAHENVPPRIRRRTRHVRSCRLGPVLLSRRFSFGSVDGIRQSRILLLPLALPGCEGHAKEQQARAAVPREY